MRTLKCKDRLVHVNMVRKGHPGTLPPAQSIHSFTSINYNFWGGTSKQNCCCSHRVYVLMGRQLTMNIYFMHIGKQIKQTEGMKIDEVWWVRWGILWRTLRKVCEEVIFEQSSEGWKEWGMSIPERTQQAWLLKSKDSKASGAGGSWGRKKSSGVRSRLRSAGQSLILPRCCSAPQTPV